MTQLELALAPGAEAAGSRLCRCAVAALEELLRRQSDAGAPRQHALRLIAHRELAPLGLDGLALSDELVRLVRSEGALHGERALEAALRATARARSDEAILAALGRRCSCGEGEHLRPVRDGRMLARPPSASGRVARARGAKESPRRATARLGVLSGLPLLQQGAMLDPVPAPAAPEPLNPRHPAAAEADRRNRSFHAVADAAREPVLELWLGPSPRVAYLNAAAERLLGADFGAHCIRGEDLEALQSSLGAPAKPAPTQLRVRVPDVGERVLEVRVTALGRDGQGHEGVLLVSTEVERAPDHGSGAIYARAFDTWQDQAVYMLEADGRVCSWGPGCERLFGAPAREVLGASFALFEPGGVEALELQLQEVARSGTTRVEGWMLRRDGSRFWGVTSTYVIRDAGGELRGYSRISRDATEDKRHEEEREQLLQRLGGERSWLHTVFTRLPLGVMLCDPEGRLRANPCAEQLAGRPLREAGFLMAGEELLTVAGEPLPPELYPGRRAARGERFEGMELIFLRADRRRMHLRFSGESIVDERGVHQGGVVFVEDLTAQRERERLTREWSSVIMHDLRQPLAAIRMTADLLRHTPRRLSETQASLNITRSAKLMERLIGDLVDSTELEAKRLSMRFCEVDVGALVEELVARVDGCVLDKHLRLEHPLPRAVISGDAERLEQVLWNLLTNAAKYGFTGSDIAISLEVHDGQAHLAVTNHGPGLEREALERLFVRFQRMHRKVMPEARGLGLGLYITKGIVEAHGGRIWAESVPNALTTFHVLLPMRGAHALSGPRSTH